MTQQPPDPLESELARLRPAPLSPELRQRIAERLGKPSWSWRRWLMPLAGAAAAGLAILFTWPKPEPAPPRPLDKPLTEDKKPDVEVPATLAHFRRALDESPDHVDRLLRPRATNSEPRPEIAAGRRFDGQFLDSLGEW